MWLFTTTPTEEFGDNKSFVSFKTNIKKAVEDAFSVNVFQTFFVELNDEATKLQRTLSNGMVGYGAQLEQKIYSIMKNGLNIGITMQDVSDYATELGDTLGRVPTIQEEVVKGMKSFSMMTGISMKELAKGIGEFDKIGMGQQEAQKKLTNIFFTAKAYGVSAKQLTTDVTKNLEKANGYQFKNGVDGLIKMAARAKQLGIDFEKIMNIGEKALDPDKAMDMAAGMQMLGGNVGALGDPFKLLYMAQNDLGALQDEFIKVTAASAEYNKETGQFKIGTQQMYRLKQMAEELGLDYQDLAKSAIKARKEQEIMPKIGGNLSEEDKQLVASMAEMKDGEWRVQLPGTDKWENIQNLSTEQIAQLNKMQEENGLDENERLKKLNDTAEAQLSKAEQQVIELRKITTLNIFGSAGSAGQKEMDLRGRDAGTANQYGDIMKAYQSMTNVLGEFQKTMTAESGTIYSDFVKGLKIGTDAMEAYAMDVNQLRKDLKKLIELLNIANATGNEKPKISDVQDVEVLNDLFIPSEFKGGRIISGAFGEFSMNPKDDFLAAPDLDSFVNNAQGAFSILNTMINSDTNKLQTLQDMLNNNMNLEIPTTEVTPNIKTETIPNIINVNKTTEIQNNLGTNMEELLTKNINLENLTKAVEVNNKTTNEVTGNVGVNGDVKIKVEGLQGSLAQILDSDPNFQRMFKENVMSIVNERLSKSYGEKLGNLS